MSPNQSPNRLANGTPVKPDVRWMLSRPERIIGFGLGTGLLRPGPGTWGTLLGYLLWLLFLQGLPDIWMALLLVVSFAAGCWIAHRCGQDLGVVDHSGINWDEIVAIWLVLWLTPAGFGWQLLALVLFRFFDILKPPPIRWLDQRLNNGFGVMVDDILAAVYSLLVMAVLLRFGVSL